MTKHTSCSPIGHSKRWNNPSKAEKVFIGMPLFGLQEREAPEIQKHFDERSRVCLECWGDENRLKIVKDLMRIIQVHFGWKNAYLIPNDRFDAVFWDKHGDLAEAEAVMEIEGRFGIDISDAQFEKFKSQCVGDFIDYILRYSEKGIFPADMKTE